MSQLHWRAFQPFMMTSVHSVHRGPPPPGPTAILSMRSSPSRCAGLKFREYRANVFNSCR